MGCRCIKPCRCPTPVALFEEHLKHILKHQHELLERVIHLATQADLDALSARIDTNTNAVTTGVTGIRQDIADLKAAHPDLDLSSLEARVSGLDEAVSGLTALDSENPVPAPTQ